MEQRYMVVKSCTFLLVRKKYFVVCLFFLLDRLIFYQLCGLLRGLLESYGDCMYCLRRWWTRDDPYTVLNVIYRKLVKLRFHELLDMTYLWHLLFCFAAVLLSLKSDVNERIVGVTSSNNQSRFIYTVNEQRVYF